jgi:flagellar assembly protein FliH
MPADPKHLTAWERWEMGSFDAPDSTSQVKSVTPTVAKTAPQAQVVLPTVAEIELMHQQAQEEGHRVGYAEGRQQAQTEAVRLAALAKQLDTALTEFDLQVSDELLALAIEIARRIVEHNLAVKPEIILDVVRHALAELPHQHASVHLNPDDAALIRTLLGEQLAHAGHRILEDPLLSRGGCLIEAGGSQVDATLRTRWRRVLESIGTPADWFEADEK